MGRRHMSIRGLQGLMVLAVLVSSVSAGTELKNTIKTIEVNPAQEVDFLQCKQWI